MLATSMRDTLASQVPRRLGGAPRRVRRLAATAVKKLAGPLPAGWRSRRSRSMPLPDVPRGRLAPSPTGRLHLGHARTFLLAWLHVRSRGGELLLRLEDLDASRCRPEL